MEGLARERGCDGTVRCVWCCCFEEEGGGRNRGEGGREREKGRGEVTGGRFYERLMAPSAIHMPFFFFLPISASSRCRASCIQFGLVEIVLLSTVHFVILALPVQTTVASCAMHTRCLPGMYRSLSCDGVGLHLPVV